MGIPWHGHKDCLGHCQLHGTICILIGWLKEPWRKRRFRLLSWQPVTVCEQLDRRGCELMRHGIGLPWKLRRTTLDTDSTAGGASDKLRCPQPKVPINP